MYEYENSVAIDAQLKRMAFVFVAEGRGWLARGADAKEPAEEPAAKPDEAVEHSMTTNTKSRISDARSRTQFLFVVGAEERDTQRETCMFIGGCWHTASLGYLGWRNEADTERA